MNNPKIIIVQSGFYFFGNEIKSKVNGMIEFNEGAIFSSFSGGKGLPGVARGDAAASVVLDRFIEKESIFLPEVNVIGIVDSINLYNWKNCKQNNKGLNGNCDHKVVALKNGFYFFGKLSPSIDGYLKLEKCGMSGGYENNGISGQCSGNKNSKMTLDMFSDNQELTFSINSCLAIFPSVDITKLKTTNLR